MNPHPAHHPTPALKTCESHGTGTEKAPPHDGDGALFLPARGLNRKGRKKALSGTPQAERGKNRPKGSPAQRIGAITQSRSAFHGSPMVVPLRRAPVPFQPAFAAAMALTVALQAGEAFRMLLRTGDGGFGIDRRPRLRAEPTPCVGPRPTRFGMFAL